MDTPTSSSGLTRKTIVWLVPDGGLTQPAGWVHVYLGSAAGPASSPTVTLTGPDGPGSWFGRCVNGAGDVKGDGYGDLMVGAEAYDTGGPGWAHLYLGTSTGVASSPAATLTGPSAGSHFGVSVASVTGPKLGPAPGRRHRNATVSAADHARRRGALQGWTLTSSRRAGRPARGSSGSRAPGCGNRCR